MHDLHRVAIIILLHILTFVQRSRNFFEFRIMFISEILTTRKSSPKNYHPTSTKVEPRSLIRLVDRTGGSGAGRTMNVLTVKVKAILPCSLQLVAIFVL